MFVLFEGNRKLEKWEENLELLMFILILILILLIMYLVVPIPTAEAEGVINVISEFGRLVCLDSFVYSEIRDVTSLALRALSLSSFSLSLQFGR